MTEISMNSTRILAAVLAVSLLTNIGMIAFLAPYQQEQIAGLITKTNLLSMQNMHLKQQLNDANLSLQGSSCSLEYYRSRLAETGVQNTTSVPGIFGAATMIAPSVSQSVRRIRNGPFIAQVTVLNGSVMNISVTTQPGRGRVLVVTKPLMGIVFQDAANTAVYVARNRTGADLSGTDVFFSIEGDEEISAVDGSSAGALMTLLSIAALEHRTIDPSVTLTGTIDENGNVGAVGGTVEKAAAAKEYGITRFLLSEANSRITIYDRETIDYRGFELIDYVPRRVEARSYIMENIGINVDYIGSIDDVLAVALK
jgi:hypothetical protein